jgi:hypothetical protein
LVNGSDSVVAVIAERLENGLLGPTDQTILAGKAIQRNK